MGGGVALAAVGCAQIAGLTGDYRPAENGGQSSAGNGGASGGEAMVGGSPARGGSGTTSTGGTEPRAGATGVNGGAVGAAAFGGMAGDDTTPGAAGAAPSTGAAGATGAPEGPFLVGYSEFHDSASGDSHANAHLADATFVKPAGTAPGDFMLVFFGADHGLSGLTPEELGPVGWTLLDQHEDLGADGQGTYLIYKFAAASEPNSIVFKDINPTGQQNGVQGLLSVYRGVNATAPINDYKFQKVPEKDWVMQDHVVTPTPAIVATVPGCLAIAGLSPDSAIDSPVITAWPDGFDQRRVSVVNPPTPYPNGWANIYAAERFLPDAGALPESAFAWDPIAQPHRYAGALSFVLVLAP